MAIPMPPPMHKVANPFLASRRCISCNRVTSTRAPEAPIGWPIAMAPPFTLTLDVSQPMSLFTAQAWAAKASLASTRSRSLAFQPAFSSALRDAGIGPDPITFGSTPACAHDLIVAKGLRPRFFASLALIRTSAAAPSLIPDAFAAVTVPSFWKAGLSAAIANVFVRVDDFLALALFDGDRCDLVLELARLLGRFRLVLRGDGETIL